MAAMAGEIFRGWVRDRGGRDDHSHEESKWIDEEMPFAALHLFALPLS
jgi:hypothetical protein